MSDLSAAQARRRAALAAMPPLTLATDLWWFGTSDEYYTNWAEADRDVPKLLQVKADMGITVAFLSMEPLLGPVDLSHWMGVHHSRDNDMANPETRDAINHMIRLARDQYRAEHGSAGIDWCIIGGESGPNARPMHPDWARSLRDQCQATGVAYFFKQWGEWPPLSQTELGVNEAYYHPAPETDPEASRRCKLDSLCIAPDGATYPTGSANQYHQMPEGAFAGPGHMQCFKVGKARAGRLLDGREWNQMPGVM